MSRALFVSDIHISSPLDPKARLFQRFLDAALQAKIDDLFLVGDIFDLWIADRTYFVETYRDIIGKLREVKGAGIRVHYFEGNHDLDLQPFWQLQMGLQVYSEAAFFTLNQRKYRVEHGDQIDPHDHGYLFLRWLLRTPTLVYLGRKLPERVVQWLGQRASFASRDYTSNIKSVTPQTSLDKIHAHGAEVVAQMGFDVLVTGHLHVVDDSEHQIGDQHFRSVNLGTWLKQPMVFVVDENAAELVEVERFIETACGSGKG